jgi:hypothetical protein
MIYRTKICCDAYHKTSWPDQSMQWKPRSSGHIQLEMACLGTGRGEALNHGTALCPLEPWSAAWNRGLCPGIVVCPLEPWSVPRQTGTMVCPLEPWSVPRQTGTMVCPLEPWSVPRQTGTMVCPLEPWSVPRNHALSPRAVVCPPTDHPTDISWNHGLSPDRPHKGHKRGIFVVYYLTTAPNSGFCILFLASACDGRNIYQISIAIPLPQTGMNLQNRRHLHSSKYFHQ